MSKDQIKTLYPIEMQMKVSITNDDGSSTGIVTFGFAVSQTPSPEDVAKAFAEVTSQLPDDYRVMTRHEHFLTLLSERAGTRGNFALPVLQENEQWHDPKSADSYCRWFMDNEDFDDER